jgi:hypothetical protein
MVLLSLVLVPEMRSSQREALAIGFMAVAAVFAVLAYVLARGRRSR